MNKTLAVEDTISGSEGVATAVIEGKVVELMELVNITGTVSKNKSEVKVMGKRGTQHKTTGWNGTGSMSIRYISSRWAKMLKEYAKTGKDFYFNIQVTNEDPSSSIGKQTVVLIGCNIDGIDITKLDLDTDVLSQDVDFTFNDFDILDSFSELN